MVRDRRRRDQRLIMRAAIICIIGIMGAWGLAEAEPLLEGRVRLDSGEPVADARVLLFDLADLRAAPLAATTDESGHFTLSLGALPEGSAALPQQFALGANYPNPFNPSTIIPYQLPTTMHVRLEVFNILGQRIATLVDGERSGGFHTAGWDATDAAGQAMAAGVYFYRLSGDGMHVTRRMVLIDGQAGVPSAGGGGLGAVVAAAAEPVPVYGMVVSGRGFVPYVDPAFRVEAGGSSVDLVVETLDSVPRAKAMAAGILGDVDNDGRVDFFDALLVALYSEDASMVMPNNGDLSLGDVNADGRVDLADAWFIAAYLNDPSDPTLPSGIGEPVGAVGFAPLDEQTFNGRMVGKSFHVETWFLDFVSAGRFSENGRLPGSYSYSNTGSNTGLLTLTYDGGQYGGGCTLQLTFASATTGALHFICDSGLEGQETWRISEIGTPLAPRVVPHSDIDTELVVIFIDFFEVGETRAYDFQIRPKTPQGSWIDACNAFTNTAGRALIGPVTQGFGGLESGTVYEARYRYRNSSRCGEGTPGLWSEIGEGATSGRGTSLLRFPDGESATRSIPENIPAGINVGDPVSAVGGDAPSTLTYTISGPDALSFDIVPETGQIRTREGVTYDYESKKYYSGTVGVEDGAGNSDMIDVTIHIVNLVPFSGLPSNLNLRTNPSDERLTLKWDPLPDAQGHARVLGYQTEIRRGSSGPWTDRRTILGSNFTRTIYTELVNEIGYQVRVRPITAEGDSEWSTPVEGIPTADLAPKDPVEHFDRFETQPVGSSDRNVRFLTPGRCRHTSGGQTLDADCQYQNTGPNTGRITLEFDDPSRGSCEVSLAYSSLTAGSFLDECFDAGVNTNVPFDQSFRLPRSAPRSEGDLDPPLDETDVPRAPRTQEEFDALVYGRDDFIPGLAFGRICLYCDRSVDTGSGWASRIGLDSDGLREFPGKYSYRNIGPSEGVLTFEGNDGNTYVFNLDFESSGNVSVTTTDPNGDVVVWPGMLHLDSTLGAEPVLLPLPPYWSEAIAIETDFAPEDWGEVSSEDWGEELESVLFGDLYEQLFSGESEGLTYLNTQRYEKIGRNRAVITVEFSGTGAAGDDDYEDLDEYLKSILGSTWTFDLTFTSDGAANVTLTITKAGELPTVAERFVDFAGDEIDLDELPDELTLPDDPPQASGEDVSGVEVAAAVSTPSIGADDVQSFLVSNAGAGYQPGDWLEPKDGSNQRMMVVGTGPPAAAKPLASSDAASPRLHQRILKMQSAISPHSSPAFSSALVPRAKRVSQPAYWTSSSTITQLSVVCMQGDRDIPTRGARYFSQPKTAQDAVQLCQQDCVLNETDNIQECVWDCEADAP